MEGVAVTSNRLGVTIAWGFYAGSCIGFGWGRTYGLSIGAEKTEQ